MESLIQVKDRQEAISLIHRDYPLTYNLDEVSKERAGYPIYRSEEEYYTYFCDLGCRIELNLSNGDTVNYVWRKPDFNYTTAPKYSKKNVTFRQFH